MVTINNFDKNSVGIIASGDYRGLSTDTKPVGVNVGNGSTFIEIDTGKLYMYDAVGQEWHEIGA